MCPSYRATRDEQHLTRGRANTLRLAHLRPARPGRLHLAGDEGDARSLRLLQGLPARVPDRRRHGQDEDRVPASLSCPARPAAEGAAGRLPAALRPARGETRRRAQPARPHARRRRRCAERSLGFSARRSMPRWQTALARARAGRRPRGGARATAATSSSSATPSTATSSRRTSPPPSGCSRAAGYRLHRGRAARAGPLCCGRTFLVGRPRRGGARRGAAHARRPLAVRRARRPRRRARALLPLHLPRRVLQPPAARTRSRRSPRPRSWSRSCSRPTSPPGATTLPLRDRSRAARPISTATAIRRRSAAWARSRRCCAACPASRSRRSSRAAAAWPAPSATTRRRSTSPSPWASCRCSRRSAPVGPDDLVVADGTSCRHQIHDGVGREAVHVARVLDAALA